MVDHRCGDLENGGLVTWEMGSPLEQEQGTGGLSREKEHVWVGTLRRTFLLI